ncbi:hypothetical protein IWW48_004667 [Coemansia sp. RSA 1200]|nr:hypothetical protein IWW48_004667 [Coemansia sp. RSA 1200]
MDVKALLETPHRSVHWAFLSRLKATTASTENPETLFAEWKVLVSPDVATKAPHVFAEAVSQIVHLTLAGRLSVLQTVQVLTDLIAPPNIQKKSGLDPSLLSAVCGGFVQLLVAGGDALAFQDARSARQNLVRVALERDPSLFSPILHHVYSSLLNPVSGAAAGNSAAADSNVAFATKWENSGRLLKYVITDPTVPSWAQNRALALIFDLLRELSADGTEPAIDRAIVVLDWLVGIGLTVAQTPEFQSTKPATALYIQVDVQGRWDPSQLVEQCARMIELVFVHANRASEPLFGTYDTDNLKKLISIVDRLKLMTASMLFSGTYGMEHIRQVHPHRASHNRDVLASVLDRLSNISMSISAHSSIGDLGDSQRLDHSGVDTLVWILSAIQAVNAKSSVEQSSYLSIIYRVLSNKVMFAGIPEPAAHVARFPLLCVASSGFNQEICSMAINICSDIDQKVLPMGPELGKDLTQLQQTMRSLAASPHVSALLPLLFSALDNYFSVYASPAHTVIETMGVMSKQPFFLAPFLFVWNTRTHPANANAVMSQTALACLIEMLPKHPNLRLDLLLLFTYLLRRPETNTNLQQILIRDSIPCLATTKDAFATSRVVSVISRLWSQSKDLKAATLPSSALLTGPTDKSNGNGQLRLCCLAVRAWTNIVIHNPRAWRDLQPVVVQFVESKKAVSVGTNAAHLFTCILDPEYEWTILMAIRDLVLHQADRYADEILPIIYALFTYARDSLSVSSTALLIDILSTCAESNAADVRNIWATILSAQAEFWLLNVDNVTDSDARSNAAIQAAPVLNALARFFKIIATSGDGSGPYVAFRYDILMRYVAPMCGLSIAKEATDSTDDDPISEEIQGPKETGLVSTGIFKALSSTTRNAFLATLSAFPADNIMSLLAGGSPARLVHELLEYAADGTTSLEISDSSAKMGCLSNLLGVLMDNEVRFMRQSLFSGRNAASRNRDGIDKQTVDVNASPSQKHVWAQSNLERSRLIEESLAPTLQRARQIYWNNLKYGGSMLASGNALASMISAGSGAIEWDDGSGEHSFAGNSDAVSADAAVLGEQQKIIAEVRSLITDVRLSDHWSLHNIAVDAWQMWFTSILRKIQFILAVKKKAESGASDPAATTANAGLKIVKDVCFKILAALRDQLDPSGVPAHVANAVYALAGLTKAVWSVDQVFGSELCVFANKVLLEYGILAWDKSPDVFWSQKAETQNRDVLVAAIECTSATAICQSHDIAALSRLAQFLMVGLTQCFASGSNMLSSSSVVYALSRSLLHLHTVLSGHIPDKRTFSEETVVVEAEDLRRFIERLDILQPCNSTEKQTSQGPMAVDTGTIGLAINLAAMHRRWISTTINPAMAEHNSTPKASQAQRTVAITIGQAFANISNVEDGQWDSRSLASLYYLCFVWPPRPITQRHIELHKDLFAVTPDRVWQTASRLMRKLWAFVAQDGQDSEMRNVNLISHTEFAFSTLTYHMTMTAGQSTAQSAHLRLVQQFSGWISGGDTDLGVKDLAANEKSDLRVSRTVALAVLLGIPMHGVAETVASNEYLPKSQQKKLPVLLGIGSVQYGTTAWLRMSESVLHESLNPVLGNSGLAQNINTGVIQADMYDAVGGNIVEMDDVRVARVSSAVLGVLYAQSVRAVHLLTLAKDSDGSAKDASDGTLTTQPDGAQQLVSNDGDGSSGAIDQTATAIDEEPTSLGHLSAPTSWCRAVWENISELAGSMINRDDLIPNSVESKLTLLFLSILRMERPFPVVAMRTVFANILDIYIQMLDANSNRTTRLPIVKLLLKVTSKLCTISYSASQFLVDCCCELASKATALACAGDYSASAMYGVDIAPDSIVLITLSCLGDMGLGRVLELSGVSSSKRNGKDDGLVPTVRQLVGTDAWLAEEKLSSALKGTLPLSVQKNEGVQKKGVVERDAERMFRLMSKVRIQGTQAANLCIKLLSCVLSGARTNDLATAMNIELLSTLESYIAQPETETQTSAIGRSATQEKMSAAVLRPLDEGTIVEASYNVAERKALLWNAAGIVYCGVNTAKGLDLVSQDMSKLDDTRFLQLVEIQSTVLQRWVACSTEAGQNSDRRVDKDMASGAVSTWLKSVFREWGRRANSENMEDQNAMPARLSYLSDRMEQCLRDVALTVFSQRRYVRGGLIGVDDACRLIVQGLDMAILAVSIYASAANPSKSNQAAIVSGALASWVLPALTGHHAPPIGSGTEGSSDSHLPFVVLACGEMLEYVDISSRNMQANSNIGPGTEAGGQQHSQQFATQLRTRIQRLLELAPSYDVNRVFNHVLYSLAIRGMLPPNDLSSVV